MENIEKGLNENEGKEEEKNELTEEEEKIAISRERNTDPDTGQVLTEDEAREKKEGN